VSEGRAQGKATVIGISDVRYSFTAQFLCSSAIFARRCAEIEQAHPSSPDDLTKTEHLGLVTSAIMQSTAAVEAESAELTKHGPGHHLGSNGVDSKALALLAPRAEDIDRLRPLERYKIILCILQRQPLAKDNQPWRDMATLIKLRNEITHYKSNWRAVESNGSKRLFQTLRNLKLSKPCFIPSGSSFFPHQLLGAECAKWSVHTAVAFIDAIYERLGVESPLKSYKSQFEGLRR
jgi:hypothetical protein